jgi:hypothetical protein
LSYRPRRDAGFTCLAMPSTDNNAVAKIARHEAIPPPAGLKSNRRTKGPPISTSINANATSRYATESIQLVTGSRS